MIRYFVCSMMCHFYHFHYACLCTSESERVVVSIYLDLYLEDGLVAGIKRDIQRVSEAVENGEGGDHSLIQVWSGYVGFIITG